jgi:uncharacterized protein YktB (UPF0637 family)
MKLIQEANLDDDFANLLMKIDDAYEKLDKISNQFTKDHRPVRSQIAMVESAADDFKKLAQKLRDVK